jgi:pantetheine-phosphate adenylyltransferase
METAIYPGTFDPVTNGHLDVLSRACRLFGKVVIAVAKSTPKSALLPIDERLQLVKENLNDEEYPGASAIAFDGLVVDFAKKIGAGVIIRGLRATSDFEHEFQMAQMNRHLDETIETMFLMPNEKYFYTSSSLYKQVAKYTDRDTGLVPENVHRVITGYLV